MERERPCLCCSFLCAVCRIACFRCIRRFCTCFFEAPPPERLELSILCLGLQGVGKTTLLALAAGEPADNVEPTLGFVIKTVNVQRHLTLSFQELGGSEQIRTYWDKYYSGRHLIMYVVDSSCSEQELIQSIEVLEHCLSSPTLSQLPLLIVCSKQDLPSARPVSQIKEQLGAGEMVRKRNILITTSSIQQPEATRDGITQAILQLLEPHHIHQKP